MFQSRKNIVFIVLAGIFITNAVVAELIGGKLIQIAGFTLSIGILPWPIVFLTTDLINEYFGKSGVRKLTLLTAGLISYAFIILYTGMNVPASSISPVNDKNFNIVFGQGMWIIIGSLVAFIISQLLDVSVFHKFKKHTGDNHIWLRATGSTIISQLIDTFIVGGIAFYLPGKVNLEQYLNMSSSGYLAKLLIAIALTPLIYIGHRVIKNYLKEEIITPEE